ncbi:MAG: peptidase [Betaproteobacteria bacterium]|nr:peptidase [Betaproteobacteria bacterium]
MTHRILIAATALAFAPLAAQAHDEIVACTNAVLKAYPGTVDVQKADGSAWDIECDAATAKVSEVEQEVSPTDAKWTSKVKVSEADAKATALKAFPGTVVETEYEIEPNGALSYEFDIKGNDGKEYKVEVDAVTGKVVESSVEMAQIGQG